jgi:hypothetical protein
MRIIERKTISQADYKRYKTASKEEIEEFVGWAAHFSPYPPAGYGMINPRVEMINNDYFAVWERRDNCD